MRNLILLGTVHNRADKVGIGFADILLFDLSIAGGDIMGWLVALAKMSISRPIAEPPLFNQGLALPTLRKKVEMPFAHLKRNLGLGRLRLLGHSRDHGYSMTLPGNACGANDEFLLAATAHNLRKLAKIFLAPQQMRKA